MTLHGILRLCAMLALQLAAVSYSRADEGVPLTKLKLEKAALEKQLSEVNAQIETIQAGQGVNWLGMKLVDPTEELMKEYGLMEKYRGPIIVKVEDNSFFPPNMVPTAGCAFWIVEHPVRGFMLNQENKEKAPSFRPRSVRELAEALLACTVTPEEYEEIYNKTVQQAREHAEALKDKPVERERWLKIAESKVPESEVGKYICRVVYNYPETKRRGTMTTYLRMTKADLDGLRAYLAK